MLNLCLIQFHISYFPTCKQWKKQWLRSWFEAPPSWIAWKKYQLYRATHERMWAMSTTSLSPNMGYVPLSLSGVSGVEWPSVLGLPNHRFAPCQNWMFNIGQGGSAIDSSLIVKIKLNLLPQQLNWPMAPGPNLWGSLYNRTLSYTWSDYLAITLQGTR